MRRALSWILPVSVAAFVCAAAAFSDRVERKKPSRSNPPLRATAQAESLMPTFTKPMHLAVNAASQRVDTERRQAPILVKINGFDPRLARRLPSSALRRLAATLSRDHLLSGSVRSELEAWKQSGNPEIARKATIVACHLKGSWEVNVRGNPDPLVRAALLEDPPLESPEGSSQAISVLLDVLTFEGVPSIRAAAWRGLPVDVDDKTATELALLFSRETDADVRLAALRTLSGIQKGDRTVSAVLGATIARPGEDNEARSLARQALLRWSDAHPGQLSEEELSLLDAPPSAVATIEE